MPMQNAMTVDVEDWFHVSRFRHLFSRRDWDTLPARIEGSMERLLEIFDAHEVKATFFVLGWVAEKYPSLVERIRLRGHEIGSHSYAHQLVYEQSPAEFEADLRRSLDILKSILGTEVRTYRAPSFSIGPECFWSLQILADNGIEVDSSLYPVRHSLYGKASSPAGIFEIPLGNGGSLMECPPSSVLISGENFPIAGGGYLRMFPLRVIQRGIRKLNAEGQPAILYLHPWEIDPGQPRVRAPLVDRMVHYSNLDVMERKLSTLLGDFAFAQLGAVLNEDVASEVWPKWH